MICDSKLALVISRKDIVFIVESIFIYFNYQYLQLKG